MRPFLALMLLMCPIWTANAQLRELSQFADSLNPDVIRVTEKVLECASKNNLEHNKILTIIDYSLPSTQKRLWVLDLHQNKLLYHTYVAHGIKSGLRDSEYFSNVRNSKTTSLGVFTTENSYVGRYGLAVKLQGQENGFNDNAYKRYLVIHPAWYVTEDFIQKYGRLGRSWGCPAISYDLVDPIINTIKENSLLVVYYPSDEWLAKSKFLTCDDLTLLNQMADVKKLPEAAQEIARDPVLFLDKNNNDKFDKDEAVPVISADSYQKWFKREPPLNRMLRRQYNGTEYIVLNAAELSRLDNNKEVVIDYVFAEVKNVGGYWATEFKPVSPEVSSNDEGDVLLKSTDEFIRWLGL